jgi:hypothetical protein
MKFVGFYRDVKQAYVSAEKSDLPALLDQPRSNDSHLIERLARYLDGGHQLGSKLGWSNDVFKPELRTSLETITDGEWVWPADAAYYCTEYRILPPNREFISKVVAHEGNCPHPDAMAIKTVEDELYGQ